MSIRPDAGDPGWSEGFVDVGGANIHYYRTGSASKPPLVLAHGFSDNGLCWSRTARALENSFDVVMLDARCHGQSSAATGEPSDLAMDVVAVIAELGLKKPVLMGHSVGASTMAVLAAERPEVANGLILEDPPWTSDVAADDPREGARKYLLALDAMSNEEIVELGVTQHPNWSDEDRPAWATAKREVHVNAAENLVRIDWADVTSRIRCPTLLICGDSARDAMTTVPVAQQIEALNPAITTEFLSGAGHNVRRENFVEFLDVVKGFLSPAF